MLLFSEPGAIRCKERGGRDANSVAESSVCVCGGVVKLQLPKTWTTGDDLGAGRECSVSL